MQAENHPESDIEKVLGMDELTRGTRVKRWISIMLVVIVLIIVTAVIVRKNSTDKSNGQQFKTQEEREVTSRLR